MVVEAVTGVTLVVQLLQHLEHRAKVLMVKQVVLVVELEVDLEIMLKV